MTTAQDFVLAQNKLFRSQPARLMFQMRSHHLTGQRPEPEGWFREIYGRSPLEGEEGAILRGPSPDFSGPQLLEIMGLGRVQSYFIDNPQVTVFRDEAYRLVFILPVLAFYVAKLRDGPCTREELLSRVQWCREFMYPKILGKQDDTLVDAPLVFAGWFYNQQQHLIAEVLRADRRRRNLLAWYDRHKTTSQKKKVFRKAVRSAWSSSGGVPSEADAAGASPRAHGAHETDLAQLAVPKHSPF